MNTMLSAQVRCSNPIDHDHDHVEAVLWLERLHAARSTLLPGLVLAAQMFSMREEWKQFGFASLHDFARERFDRSSRWRSTSNFQLRRLFTRNSRLESYNLPF